MGTDRHFDDEGNRWYLLSWMTASKQVTELTAAAEIDGIPCLARWFHDDGGWHVETIDIGGFGIPATPPQAALDAVARLAGV